MRESGFEEPVFGEGEANDGSLKNEAQACVFIGLQKLGPSLRRRWLLCGEGGFAAIKGWNFKS